MAISMLTTSGEGIPPIWKWKRSSVDISGSAYNNLQAIRFEGCHIDVASTCNIQAR